MKSGIVFLLILSVVIIKTSSADKLDELRALAIESMKQCVDETKITPEIIAKIMNYETITEREGKCFRACVMRRMGIMGPDDKMNINKMIEETRALPKANEEKLAIVADIMDECNQHSETDKCEIANIFCECIFRHEKFNIVKELMTLAD